MMELALLLQSEGLGDPGPVGLFHFFAGFLLVALIFGSFLGFTYWISKDE